MEHPRRAPFLNAPHRDIPSLWNGFLLRTGQELRWLRGSRAPVAPCFPGSLDAGLGVSLWRLLVTLFVEPPKMSGP